MSLIYSNRIKTCHKDREIIVIDLRTLTDTDKNYVKKELVEITEGINSCKTKTSAKRILDRLRMKSTEQKIGLAAEFFLACIIRNQNFEQCYCYNNLEENSAKKGFDGLFVHNDDIWLLESKASGTPNSHNYKHKNTIKKAYAGLNNMLNGDTSNDPWRNASNHALISGSKSSLIEKLNNLSESYVNNEFQDIKDFNVLLGSSIFDANINKIEKDVDRLETYLLNHTHKKELLICLNIAVYDLFESVLEEIVNE